MESQRSDEDVAAQAASAEPESEALQSAREESEAREEWESESRMTEKEMNELMERLVKEADTSAESSKAKQRLPVDDENVREVQRLKDRGNRFTNQKLYSEAVDAYTTALKLCKDNKEIAILASNRSAAFASLSQHYRSRPAAQSEASALYGLDPSHLAALALKDANRAVQLRPDWAKAYSRQGMALYLCEKYDGSREAYLQGLLLEPTNKALQEGLTAVQKVIDDAEAEAADQAAAAIAGTGGAGASGAAGAAEGEGGAGGPSLARVSSSTSPGGGLAKKGSLKRMLPRDCEDVECVLCAKLLFEPATTPCGHSFCRGCFARSMDHSNKCPMCRTVLHVGRDLPVSITLAALISKSFPTEYEERRKETAEEQAHGSDGGAAPSTAPFQLPLFVMSSILPGEHMGLNIFEPRYRLLVRRCMEGSRRFGMAQVRADRTLEDVACEVEIVECTPQPDGRYYLEIRGRRRVRILSSSELDGYRVARVQAFSDTPPAPGSPRATELSNLAATVGGLADQFVTRIRTMAATQSRGARIRALLDEAGPKPPTDQAEALSFWVGALAATFLPDAGHDRMDLLRLEDTHTRLSRLRDRFVSVATDGAGAGGCCVM